MIIQKKETKASEIQAMNNYVLIKPDEDLETYQIKGKETGIIAPSYTYDKGKPTSMKDKRRSVFGTVYSCTPKLNYHGIEIKYLRDNNRTHAFIDGQMRLVNFEVQKKIDELIKKSVIYDSEPEVGKGDRVMFTYLAHRKAIDNNMIVDTPEGQMYFITYDMLYCTIKEGQPDKMLNGWVIVEPEMLEKETETLTHKDQSWDVSGVKTASGLLIPTKQEFKKSRKNQRGTIVNFGSICKGYLQEPEKSDFREPLTTGMKIIYDPRTAKPLEYESHQSMSEKKLQLIQRKDIIVTEMEFPEIDTLQIK